MKKISISACLFIYLILTQIPGQAQYKININYANPQDSILYFRVATFDDKLFIPKDTIVLKKNAASISYHKSIFGGIYYIYFPQSKKKLMLCLENNDNISLTLNGNDWENGMVTSQTKNKLFLEYQKLENNYEYLDSQYAELQKKGKATLRLKEAMYKVKKDTLMAFRKKAMLTLNKTGLLYKYFNVLNILDDYTPNKNNFQERNVFLNKFNVKDEQLYFTPVLKEIFYEYLSSYPLVADSAINGMEVVMKKLNCKDKAYSNTFNYFASILQNSSIKENLKGYTAYIEKYLINNSCSFLPKQSKESFMITYNRLKGVANTDSVSEISLKDTSGNTQSLLSNIKAYDYTVISFFDPTCEHCKVQMPELDSTLKEIRKKTSLKILNFAICNTPYILENEWKKFINGNKLEQDYVHVILGEDSKIRDNYAAYSNPIFYLIDKKGNILLKKASIPAIKKILLTKTNAL